MPDDLYPPHLIALLDELGIPLPRLQERGLLPCSEAASLVLAEVSATGREFFLTPAAAAAWQALREAAAGDGIALYLVSAFRSVDYQAGIIRRKQERGLSLDDILAVSAAPGFSEHHSGAAIDIGTPGRADLEEEFENSAAFRWLLLNAGRFGFMLSYPRDNVFGYAYEPWHWRHGDSLQQGSA